MSKKANENISFVCELGFGFRFDSFKKLAVKKAEQCVSAGRPQSKQRRWDINYSDTLNVFINGF